MKYMTREGDMLDQICLEYYQRRDVVPQVLAANPHLADQSPVLPAGVIIYLPTLTLANAQTTVRLWD